MENHIVWVVFYRAEDSRWYRINMFDVLRLNLEKPFSRSAYSTDDLIYVTSEDDIKVLFNALANTPGIIWAAKARGHSEENPTFFKG